MKYIAAGIAGAVAAVLLGLGGMLILAGYDIQKRWEQGDFEIDFDDDEGLLW